MISATVIYYKTAALASAVEKDMLVLTPFGIHFTWNKRTAFLRELSVLFFILLFRTQFCLWDSWNFVNKLPLIYVIWIDFARLLTVWEPPSPVLCPVLETFLSSGWLTFSSALIQRAAVIFPPPLAGPSSWNEASFASRKELNPWSETEEGPFNTPAVVAISSRSP